MNRLSTHFAHGLLALCLPLLVQSNSLAAAAHVPAVVVSPKNPATNLSLGDLRKIFSGDKRTWPDGTRVKLFTRAPRTIEFAALLKLLGKSEADYKQYWTSKVYQGEAESEPMVLPSEGMQREALAAYPGAISLVDADTIKPGMKVLKIDGKLPEDDAYPLRP